MATLAVTLGWAMKCYIMTSEDTDQALITVPLFVTKNRQRRILSLFSVRNKVTLRCTCSLLRKFVQGRPVVPRLPEFHCDCPKGIFCILIFILTNVLL